MNGVTRIVWDWNGTLLDDVDASVTALGMMLAKRGLPPVAKEDYRLHFGFPVRPVYAHFGIDLEKEDWDEICTDFHRFIREQPQCLRPDALAALAAARNAGFSQAVLSALRQDLLRKDVAHFGAAPFMDAVFGVDNLDGATKLSRGRELMEHLGASPQETVIVGDTLHDAEVAQALGTGIVLVAGGHQARHRLAESGARTVDSLAEAVEAVREMRDLAFDKR